MMAWIESHQELGQHPKTRKAARMAGTTVPAMLGHLHLVWHWALDFAQEGDITAFEPWQIEDAAMWDGTEGALFDALLAAGFIDTNDGVCTLHDWHDYAGKLIERRRHDAARKRGNSGQNPPERPRNNNEFQRNSDGTPTEGAQNPSVTLTVTPTVTVPNEELPLTPQGGDGRPELTSIDGGKKPPASDRRFAIFWEAYPNKTGKQAAKRWWDRERPDEDLLRVMVTAIDRQKRTDKWQRDGGRYIPNPHTWLNQGRWEDVIETTTEQRDQNDWSHRKVVLA